MRVKFLFSSRRTRQIDPHNKHNVPVPEIVKDVIRISDIVLMVLDSRFFQKTRNKEIEEDILSQGKMIIYVLNKADLVEINKIKEEVEIEGMKPYAFISCKTRKGVRDLKDRIKMELKKMKLKGKGYKRAHVGIVGYPNTGKSSLLNILTGKGTAGTSSEAGFTKGMKKIKLSKDLLLIDTPGVIPGKEDKASENDKIIRQKHAEIDVERYTKVKDPEFVVVKLMKAHPGMFERYYKIEANGDAEIILEELGKRNHFLLKGGVIDLDRTARLIIRDWQEGDIREESSGSQ